MLLAWDKKQALKTLSAINLNSQVFWLDEESALTWVAIWKSLKKIRNEKEKETLWKWQARVSFKILPQRYP